MANDAPDFGKMFMNAINWDRLDEMSDEELAALMDEVNEDEEFMLAQELDDDEDEEGLDELTLDTLLNHAASALDEDEYRLLGGEEE